MAVASSGAEVTPPSPRAWVDGIGPGWRALGESDFVNVNCASNTWTFTGDLIACTGQPVGVIRSTHSITNLELVVEWRRLRSGGNSGVFLWATERSIRQLEQGHGRLPEGIEVQVLDHGYTEQYERESGKRPTGSRRMAMCSPPEAPK